MGDFRSLWFRSKRLHNKYGFTRLEHGFIVYGSQGHRGFVIQGFQGLGEHPTSFQKVAMYKIVFLGCVVDRGL